MDESNLPKPKRKKGGENIERKYPFPICEVTTSDSSGKSKTELRNFVGHLQLDHVLVNDVESMDILYNMGYFGKGTLSRGEPLFHSGKDALESSSQWYDIEKVSVPNSNIYETTKKTINSNQDLEARLRTRESSFEEAESLQLTFEEAFFLSYGLGRLVVMDNKEPLDIIKLWQKFCELSPDQTFPIMYTVYHHFRSKGWVVRCGIKYGAEYVLYKDGPPFFHSTYTVVVKSAREKDLTTSNPSSRMFMTWVILSALNRINAHTAKAVLLVHVITPDLTPEQKSSPLCIYRFKIQEQLIKRWVPNEEREQVSSCQ